MKKAVVFALVIAAQILASVATASEKPNIVWIMSEDNSKHYLKHFDDMGAEAPNIEALAAEGLTFDRAFSCAAVCSVARTTLITGVYAPRLGTQYHRRIAVANMPEGWKMFPALLREAGYYTTNNSKKDYNAVEGKDVWDESSKNAHWRNRPEGKPFFHVQTFTDSHESSLHFKQDWADNPDNRTATDAVSLAPYHPDTPLFRLTYARYHDRIKSIDDKVGKIIRELREDDLFDDTIIFYFGDHGGVLPRGKGYIYESGLHVPLIVRWPNKWEIVSPYAVGSRTNGFVEFVDFAPTVLNLAEVDIPDYMDGEPFMGVAIEAKELISRNETFGYVDRMDEKYDFCRSIRVGNWKYIRNFQAIYPDGLRNNYRYEMLAYREWRDLFAAGKLNAVQQQFFQPKPVEQLFDLSSDPFEVTNVAREPGHQAVLVNLRSKLTDRLKEMPDLSFIPESDLVDGEALKNPIEFGRQHKSEIARLIDIANLQLGEFEAVKADLQSALQSQNQWERYWALMACCTFGKQASELFSAAKELAAKDPDLLVRLRACEFLGLTGQSDPMPTIKEILTQSKSPTINLIALQTLVHFKDGPFEYDTTIDTNSINAVDDQVMRRIGYLDGLTIEQYKQKMRQRSKAKKRR